MTYVATYNSVLDVDDAVMTSISEKDALGLADALERGGCRPGTNELEYLLAAARGEAVGVRLVRKKGRPKAGDVSVFYADSAWLRDGLPSEMRSQLITMLRNGAVRLGSQKRRGAGLGRPKTGICPLAAAGADIHAIALELAKERQPNLRVDYDLELLPVPEECLVDAKEEWIIRSLNGRERKMGTEVDTWNRKVRAALQAYDDFVRRFAK